MRCKAMVDEYERYLNDLPGGRSAVETSRALWEAQVRVQTSVSLSPSPLPGDSSWTADCRVAYRVAFLLYIHSMPSHAPRFRHTPPPIDTAFLLQRVASAALHPDTGEFIPHPFRMSGYVPFNGPICVAMVASQSTSALLFWSWANQSQNALVNYYNRNASSEMTNETLLTSYGAAVTSALGVAFRLAKFVQRRYDPAVARNMLRYVAFPSAVVASSMNCYIVRSPEMRTGMPLVNSRGERVLPNETSTIAAERGVNSTTLSRALLQAPVYFLPPFMMGALPVLRNAIANNPAMRVPMTTYLLLVCFGIGLPASVAIFPQMGEIRVEDAEEKYRGLVDERDDGSRPYDVLYYNKGL